MLKIPKSTASSILRNDLNMKKINLRWIPHQLLPHQKQKRMDKARILYNRLIRMKPKKLNRVLTEDEIWIYYNNPRRSMWLEYGSKVPDRVKNEIGSKKAMISVIWSRSGIKSISMLPADQTFTKEFFSEVVLNNLRRDTATKGKFFHCDNAPSHRVPEKFEELGLKRLPHPPYSPDIAPSDFFLFGYLKKQLEGYLFESHEELFEKVCEILHSIPMYFFVEAYLEWISRLSFVFEHEGDYVH